MQLAATWASIPGDSLRADFTVTNAWIAAGPQPLGRPLTGALNQVNLIAPATLWGERRNNIDLRIAKILRFGGTRTQVGVDIYNLLNADTVTNYNYGFVAGWLVADSDDYRAGALREDRRAGRFLVGGSFHQVL